MVSLCQTACAQHYADDPHVSAACTAGGAFETPTLVSDPSLPSIPRIPATYEDGDGLWYEPQPLSCNLEGGDWIAAPPEASIDMPASVTCGATVEFDVDVVDPDFDVVSVRWEIDGVLLHGSVDEIEVDEAHEIRVVVRDLRGATATDVHQITCTPP